MGHADPQYLWLAEALLSLGRGLCSNLQGADGDHRLGLLRHRSLREVRELHGPLRLRADRGRCHAAAAVAGAAGLAARSAYRWRDGAGDRARSPAARTVRLLAAGRAQAL